MDGNLVGQYPLDKPEVHIDVSQLNAGSYVIKIWGEDGRIVNSKFIKH